MSEKSFVAIDCIPDGESLSKRTLSRLEASVAEAERDGRRNAQRCTKRCVAECYCLSAIRNGEGWSCTETLRHFLQSLSTGNLSA